jgi:hypothetical protein
MGNGFEYTGQWLQGEIEGDGTAKYENNDIYIGAFIKGKRHGKGKMFYFKGQIMEGEWKNGRPASN